MSLMLVLIGVFAPFYYVPEVAVAEPGVPQESTLTFTSINPMAKVTFGAISPEGTFSKSSESERAKFSVMTNNYTGFIATVRAAGDATLTNGTDTLAPLDDMVYEAGFAAPGNTMYNNKWGIRHMTNGVIQDPFVPVSTEATTVGDEYQRVLTPTIYEVEIGARADYEKSAGTYTNTLIFEIVANPVNYAVVFEANAGGDTVTNMPDMQAGHTSATSIVLAPNVPVRAEHTFLGWCISNTAIETCPGTLFQPGDTFGIDLTMQNSVSLHAIWQFDGEAMQNLADASCTATPSRVKDLRDGKVYTVTRLADGKCWMTTNLDLAGGTALSATDTDVTSAYIGSFSTSNNLTKTGDTLVLPSSSTSGFSNDNYSYVYNSNSMTCGNSQPCYSYYSWDAATLGSGRSITTGNTDAPYSVCPKGWRLPNTYTGESVSDADAIAATDFRALMIAYGGSYAVQNYSASTNPTGATMYGKISASPVPNFILTGYYDNNSIYSGGFSGHYWSSTSTNSNYARRLYFNSTYVSTVVDGYRRFGYAVRCVLKEPTINDITYLQDFANLSSDGLSSVLASMTPETNYTKKDARDNQDYTIAKLLDNKIWMTKNLNLAGGTALSASDTNVSSEYVNGFSTSNNLTKADDTLVLPVSSASGFTDGSYSYIYNGNSATCGNSQPCYSYYSWDAATLGSGRSLTTDNTDAPYSICPKGWKLPNTYNGTSASDADAIAATDFRALMIAYGGSYSIQAHDNSTNPTGVAMYGKISASPVPNFLLTGDYGGGSFYGGGSNGYYWSSTSSGSDGARSLGFNFANVYPADNWGRMHGFAVRCVINDYINK